VIPVFKQGIIAGFGAGTRLYKAIFRKGIQAQMWVGLSAAGKANS